MAIIQLKGEVKELYIMWCKVFEERHGHTTAPMRVEALRRAIRREKTE